MNIYRMVDIKKTYTIAAGASVGSATDYWEGKLMQLHIRMPSTLSGAGASGGTLTLRNGDGYTIYTAPGCASATNTNVYLGESAVCLPSNDRTTQLITLNTSAAANSSIVVLYKVYGQRGDQ